MTWLFYSVAIASHVPLTLSFRAYNLPFLQILPTVSFLFFFPGFPGLFTDTCEGTRFFTF